MSDCLQPRGLQPTRLLCPWGCPGKSTGVGCHAPLQGIFPTQGLNPLSYVSCIGRQVLDHSRYLGSPMYTHILEYILFMFVEFFENKLHMLGPFSSGYRGLHTMTACWPSTACFVFVKFYWGTAACSAAFALRWQS